MSAILETIGVLRKGYDEKEAEAAALREALEEARQSFVNIGWEAHANNKNRRGRLRRIFETAHKGKLAMDAALSADAGREMLERVRALERELHDLQTMATGS